MVWDSTGFCGILLLSAGNIETDKASVCKTLSRYAALRPFPFLGTISLAIARFLALHVEKSVGFGFLSGVALGYFNPPLENKPHPIYDGQMGFLWLIFLCIVGYVIHRWGEEGGNALWLGGVAFVIGGSILGILSAIF